MPRKKKAEYIVPFEGEENFIVKRDVYDNNHFVIASDSTGSAGVKSKLANSETYLGVVAPTDGTGGTKEPPPLEPTGGDVTGGGGQTPTGGGDGGQAGSGTTSGGTGTSGSGTSTSGGSTTPPPPLPSIAEISAYTCQQLEAKIAQLVSQQSLYAPYPQLYPAYQQILSFARNQYTTKGCTTTTSGGGTTTGGGTSTTTTQPTPTTTVTTTTQLIPSLGTIGRGFGAPVGGGGGGGEEDELPVQEPKANYLWLVVLLGVGAFIYFRRKKQ